MALSGSTPPGAILLVATSCNFLTPHTGGSLSLPEPLGSRVAGALSSARMRCIASSMAYSKEVGTHRQHNYGDSSALHGPSCLLTLPHQAQHA